MYVSVLMQQTVQYWYSTVARQQVWNRTCGLSQLCLPIVPLWKRIPFTPLVCVYPPKIKLPFFHPPLRLRISSTQWHVHHPHIHTHTSHTPTGTHTHHTQATSHPHTIQPLWDLTIAKPPNFVYCWISFTLIIDLINNIKEPLTGTGVQ